MSFLKISTVRIGEAARKRKIRSGDILLAIDGYMFTQDTKDLKKKFEDKSQAPWLLTFKRGELIFDVFFDEPLKSDFDITTWRKLKTPRQRLKNTSMQLGKTIRPMRCIAIFKESRNCRDNSRSSCRVCAANLDASK